MARYIRVRATQPQGCYRAGMFHGVEPAIYDKAELSADQIRLLMAENGRMLLVDEVDDPDAGSVVPNGDQVPGAEQVESRPELRAELDGVISELEELKAQRIADAADTMEKLNAAEKAASDAQAGQRKAEAELAKARKALKAAEAEVAKLKAAAKPGAVDKQDETTQPLD